MINNYEKISAKKRKTKGKKVDGTKYIITISHKSK